MSDELPDGWKPVKVRDAGRVQLGRQRSPALHHGSQMRPYLRVANVFEDEIRLDSVMEMHFDDADVERFELHPGDILLNEGQSPQFLGRPAMYRGELPGACFTNSLIRFQASEAIDSRFALQLFRHWMRSGEFQKLSQITTNIAHLSAGRFADMELPVPPLPEQRRIVAQVEALLADVNKAQERLDRVPAILKRFRQAVLAAACSGELTRQWRVSHPELIPVSVPDLVPTARRGRRGANLSGDGTLLVDDEMPELPETWSYARMDRLTDPATVITYGIVLPGPEVEGGVPYVRGQDVEDGRLLTDGLRHTTTEIASKHPRSELRAGDVLLCIIRNLRVAIVPPGIDGANITQGMVRIRPSPTLIHRDFIASYLMSPIAQGWMKRRYFGMDMPRINVEDARAIPVALPPRDEQDEIVRQVTKLFTLAEAIERRAETAIARAYKLPQAILSKAFSGELVPTEAELARAEGRTYETAAELLAMVRREREVSGETSSVRRVRKSDGRARGPRSSAG